MYFQGVVLLNKRLVHYLLNKSNWIGIVLILIACKSNQIQTETTATVEEKPTTELQEIPMSIIAPSRINPDDCRLTIRISEISGLVISGTIVEIKERGFGFKDYINNGDSREFKLLGEVDGLKAGKLIIGTISTIGNPGENIYTLRGIEIIK